MILIIIIKIIIILLILILIINTILPVALKVLLEEPTKYDKQ